MPELAVQRFQVYGLLSADAKEDDRLTVEVAATLINAFFDGAELDPEDVERDAAEEDIAEMLLVVLGYNEYREDAIGMAESIGLRPSGMLREFSLGDMMLYLDAGPCGDPG